MKISSIIICTKTENSIPVIIDNKPGHITAREASHKGKLIQ